MNSDTIKHDIEANLRHFDEHPLREAATAFLNTLGYHSRRVGNDGIDSDRYQRLKAAAAETANPTQKLRMDDWQAFYLVLQVTDTEINAQITQQKLLFESTDIDDTLMRSYMFVAVQLAEGSYTRTQLSDITRFINRQLPQPIMVIFRYSAFLTLAIINRRRHKREPEKRVLEKVTLIKDINLHSPHRAHLDILAELHLNRLIETEGVHNFDTLHKVWEGILNTEALNRRFYRDLEKWYDWAKAACRFPDAANAMQGIRLITRLLFIWFLKEKGLVPPALFEKEGAQAFLRDGEPHASSTGDRYASPQSGVTYKWRAQLAPTEERSDYYQAVLQNLFFATLNTPISERIFSRRNNPDHRDASKYRYADLLQDADAFLEYLKHVPFVNGGLFDCLDTFEAPGDGGARVDCFTDNPNDRRKLHVPTKLFFDEENGIFPLFSRYKFTVEENTPIEQEVALDPELLGQVFENLLGASNPETQSTARKATGSYYTPRQIVDYMVDEALIAYFLQKVEPSDGHREGLEGRLREDLLAYDRQGTEDNPNKHLIYEDEIMSMIQAIDELKIIDPAVGSGAFPMGILNKLVLILQKLDPQNERWKQRQLEQAETIPDLQSREAALAGIEQVFSEANRYNDYGRKLYLIQNGIYGVDIQPIAVTIAKLRFFISLIIEQVPNENRAANYGIRPLPNLEVKFVAANTLIGLNTDAQQLLLETDNIRQIRAEIGAIRQRYFNANTRQRKLRYIRQEARVREQLKQALIAQHVHWVGSEQNKIAEQVAQLQTERTRTQLREKLQKAYTVREKRLKASVGEAQKIANWDAYDQNAVADFFDAEWMFGVKDGFDIAIGNPPYIRHEKIRHLKPALKTQFGDFFSSTADISVYFYKRAAELLRNDGILTYICTNKFMRGGYGKNLRRFLTSEMSLKTLLDFGGISIFDAAVDTCIVLVEKCLPPANHTFRAATLREDSEEFNVREVFQEQAFPMQVTHLAAESWTLTRPETTFLLEKLQNTGTLFGQYVHRQIHRGIVTGCDQAFVIDATTCEDLISEDTNSAEIIKPWIRGRDIRKWKTTGKGKFLIAIASSTNKTWPWSDAESDAEAEQIFAETYPAIYQHLNGYRKRLIARDDQGKFYWEFRSCRYYSDFEKPKIIYADIGKFINASYDTVGRFCGANWFLPTNDLSLLAILNSTLFDWYARHKLQTLNDPWAGGGLRFKITYMKHVPIADRTSTEKAELSRLVEQILADPESDEVPVLEREIDALVYRLYGLSEEEIALIEQTYRDAGM